jgi:selT/selW/selH-like putative selenoprotein
LQAAIKKEFGVTASLQGGHSGVFDVVLDGTRIYSKDETYRFPTNEEIFEGIRKHQKA